MRGDWKKRERQLIPSNGPEWMGICHHEQDIGLPSKWGFLFTYQCKGFFPEQLITCCVNIKIVFLYAG